MSRYFRCCADSSVGCRMLVPALLTALALAGCKSQDEPITSATSKFEVADEDEASPEDSDDATEAAVIERTANNQENHSRPVTGSPTLSELDQATLPGEDPTTPPDRAAARSGVSQRENNPSNGSRNGESTGADASDTAQASDSSGDVTQLAPPVVSQESLESLTPPQGPPEAIWDFIVQLEGRRPRGRTDRELMTDIQRILAARIQAAELILKNTNADPELRRKSVNVKVRSLEGLLELGVAEARDHLLRFAQGLRQDRDAEVAGMGRLLSFTLLVNRLMEGQIGDTTPVLAAAQQLLKEEPASAPNEQLVMQVSAAAITLMDAGFMDEGKQLVELVRDKYTGSGFKEIDDILQQLGDEALFQELGLSKKLQEFAADEPDSLNGLLEGARAYLEPANPGIARLQRVLFIGEALERKHQVAAAKELYDQIVVAFKDAADPELSKAVEETLTYASRRMSLLDSSLTVEGTLSDGTPLDWSQYQGKVVLVTFWAAQNLQFVQQELQAFKGLLDTYRDRGFAIVSINVDDDRDRVTTFLKFQPLPWPTVLDGSDGQRVMMEKCGVSSVPFNLLLDQNGTVVELHSSSTTLNDRLAAMLGQPDTSPPSGQQPDNSQTGSIESPDDATTYFVSCSVTEDVVADNEEDADAATNAEDSKEDDNPYLAPADLDRAALAEFLLKMEEKPQSIRERPGFDEALVDAADRILNRDADDSFRIIALDVKLRMLHRQAIAGREGADEQLWQLVQSLADNAPQRIAQDVEMLALEHDLLAVDELPIENVSALLDRAHTQMSTVKLDERHVRLASATVHAINRLEVKEREPHFQRFGTVFAKSSDRRLAAYGRRVAATDPKPNVDLVGKEIELAGATALGVEFDWAAYRGKVVLVDFWATWCGPCRAEMPVVKKLWEEYRERGLEIVGVNLDKNVEQLGKYLDEQSLPWTNLVGDGAFQAAERYEIQGIPTVALVDREGKVVAVGHSSAELITKIQELLQ